MRHPLLEAHPILPLLAADLRARPGLVESDEGNPARAAVAIVLRARSELRDQSSELAQPSDRVTDSPSHEGLPSDRVTESPSHEGLPSHGVTEPPSPEGLPSDRVTESRSHRLTESPSHDRTTLDVLLIQRAERHGDPWSGQVALPGGRSHPDDATLQDTAVRETREETGIDLAADGLVLGILDEIRPRTPVLPPIIVTPFVAVVPAGVPLQISDELADAFWTPWSTFADPARIDESTVQVRGAPWKVSSYLVGERVVWGMTERMLRQLAERMSALWPG